MLKNYELVIFDNPVVENTSMFMVSELLFPFNVIVEEGFALPFG